MNLLSIFTSHGLLLLVFQREVGAGPLGFQQFCFGLAAAAFPDATIARMILVPAWLPEIHIDGAPPTSARSSRLMPAALKAISSASACVPFLRLAASIPNCTFSRTASCIGSSTARSY
jgi:hypothetical protein